MEILETLEIPQRTEIIPKHTGDFTASSRFRQDVRVA
jgi:hypothetical protein